MVFVTFDQHFILNSAIHVCMFLQTAVPCVPAGAFSCPLVVTMRPIPADLLDAAVEVTHLNPLAHGAPIHIGDPGKHADQARAHIGP